MSQLYLIDRHHSPLAAARILDVQESAPPPAPPLQPTLSGRMIVKVPDGVPVAMPQNLGDLLVKKARGYLLFYPGFTRVTFDDLTDAANIDFVASSGVIAGERGTVVLQPGGVLQSLTIPLIAGHNGAAAAVTVSGPTVTVTGLTGMDPAFVGGPLQISGSSIPANNGTFPIASYISPTSVTITNPFAHTDTGGDGWSLGLKPPQVFVTWDTYNLIETDDSAGLYNRQYNELPSVPAFVSCNVSFDGGTTFLPTTDSAVLSIPPIQQGNSFIIQLRNTSNQRIGIGSWHIIY